MPDYLLAAHIQVTGGTEAAAALQGVETQIKNFNTAAKSAGTGQMAGDFEKASASGGLFSGVLDRVGNSLLRMGTYQGVALVESALRSAVGGVLAFDAAMTNSLSIQSGVTDQIRGKMEALAETIAVKFGEMPKDVAQGFYYLASAGLTVDQQMADLPVVAAFARAGMMDLSKATDMLFDSLSAVGLKVADPMQQMQNLSHLSDLLVKASIDSMGTIEDFGNALQTKAGAATKAFGIDLNDTIALLEVFADEGIKGNVAGTTFANLIRDMTGKVTAHSAAWKQLGIDVYDANGAMLPLGTILHSIDAALLPMSTEDRRKALASLGFTLKDMGTVMAVLGRSDQFDAFKAGLESAGGIAESVADKQMQALSEKLNQLKAVTMVWSIQGFEKLEEAAAWIVATFSPAVHEVVEALGHLVAGAAPIAGALGKMVAVGVVAGLQGIAAAVETVFSVINAHPGAIEALGAALAALAAVQVASALWGLVNGPLRLLQIDMLLGAAKVRDFAAAFNAIDLAQGPLAALKFGFSSLLEAINPVALAVAAVGVELYVFKKAYDDSADAEKKFREGLAVRYDLTSLEGTKNALIEMHQHMMDVEASAKNASIFTAWLHLGEVQHAESDMRNLNQQYANNYIGLRLLNAEFTGGVTPIGDWAAAMKHAGMNIDDMHVGDVQNQIKDLAEKAGLAGKSVGDITPQLLALAQANHMDLSKPVAEWVPQLAAAYIQLQLVRQATGDMGGVAEGTVGQMSSFETAISNMGDESQTAEKRVKAFKDVVDGLSNGLSGEFDSVGKFNGAMSGLGTALAGTVPSFDASTDAGRKQREALSGAAAAARDMAVAHATATGDVQQGAAALRGFADSIGEAMRKAGVGEDQIAALQHLMGLTPSQINTVFGITDDASGATKDIQTNFANTGQAAYDAAHQIDGVRDALDKLTVPASNMEASARLGNDLLALGDAAIKYVKEQGPLETAFTGHTKAANDLQIQLSGLIQTQATWSQHQLDQGNTQAAIDGMKNLQQSVSDLLGPLGLTDDQINGVLKDFGLTDDAINNLKPGVTIPVSQQGAEAVTATLNNTAKPGGQDRVAPVQAVPTNIPPAAAALDGVAQNRTAHMLATPTNVPPAVGTLDGVAQNRFANMIASVLGGPLGTAEYQLNQAARTRTAYIDVEVRQLQQTIDANTAAGYVPFVPVAQGAIFPGVTSFASGGFENHIAQFAKAGAMRLWAEPETGGEAYIPLAESKRARSMQIWEEAGRMMGVRPGGPVVNISAPVSVSVDGSQSPSATAQAVASQVESSLAAFTRRLVTELQAR